MNNGHEILLRHQNVAQEFPVENDFLPEITADMAIQEEKYND